MPRKYVVRINDHPEMTSAVYHGHYARNPRLLGPGKFAATFCSKV